MVLFGKLGYSFVEIKQKDRIMKTSAERHEKYDIKGRILQPPAVKADHRLGTYEDLTETRLTALQIATGVFSHISTVRQGSDLIFPRTIKDFRESVDAVFKAAGLELVDWE